ncbi:hypothetical protein QQ045_002923 [Rhodiola kirilowii]
MARPTNVIIIVMALMILAPDVARLKIATRVTKSSLAVRASAMASGLIDCARARIHVDLRIHQHQLNVNAVEVAVLVMPVGTLAAT